MDNNNSKLEIYTDKHLDPDVKKNLIKGISNMQIVGRVFDLFSDKYLRTFVKLFEKIFNAK